MALLLQAGAILFPRSSRRVVGQIQLLAAVGPNPVSLLLPAGPPGSPATEPLHL